MGIIGIVSALTLPNLNSSTGEKEKVAKVQKLYSNLQDAYGRMIAVYGPIDEWSGGDSDTAIRFLDRMKDFMKVSKYCGKTSPENCFDFKNSKTGEKDTSNPTMITADGTALLYWGATSCSKINTTDTLATCGTIVIDIDGTAKGKNVESYDQFAFTVTPDQGIIPQGQETQNYNSATSCLGWKSYCAGWVIDYGNMDYLKANNTQHKCPNGKILSANVTSCK